MKKALNKDKPVLIHSRKYPISSTEYLTVFVLLLIFFLTGVNSISNKAPTFDEPAHITGGYTVLTEKDYRINPENGLLPQIWAALPLLSDNLNPINKKSRYWKLLSNWNTDGLFLFKSGNDPDKIFFQGRIMILLAALLLGFAVFAVSRQVWGRTGGIISLILFVLSPTIMANARLVTSDLFSALFFFLSAWLFKKCLDRLTIPRAILMELSVAALFLSKMSAPLIFPVFLILIAIRLIRRKQWQADIFGSKIRIDSQKGQATLFLLLIIEAGLVAFLVIWALHGFRYSMLSDGTGAEILTKNWQILLKSHGLPQKFIQIAREYHLLPEAYLYGFAHVLHESTIRYSFLAGNYSPVGWWYFFPLAFLLKTPPSIIVILLFGFCAIFANSALRRTVLINRLAFAFALGGIYILFSLTTNLNIGHRHLLVLYPLIFVIAGGAAKFAEKSLIRKMSLAILLIYLLIENIMLYPNYLTYFTPAAGGPSQGYKYLVDSSLDWGQDINQLKKWFKQHNIPEDKVYFSYFGSTSLTDYGVPYKKLLCCFEQHDPKVYPLKPGYYCFSATMLQMVYYPEMTQWNDTLEKLMHKCQPAFLKILKMQKTGKCDASPEEMKYLIRRLRMYERLRSAKIADYLRRKKPLAIIGNSIMIYKLDKDTLQSLFIKRI